ncbi:MAG: KR domain-containing protein, partial [Acidobacteriota bacterium]
MRAAKVVDTLGSADFARAAAPKLAAGHALRRCLAQRGISPAALTLFTFSSIAAAWGSKGQAPYGAANAYLDALAARGINVVLLWSYIATSAQSQRQDPRIGYDAPEIWPWKGSPDERNLDLTAFNPAYFERLHEFVQYADSRNIVVVITVQDGWPKTRFACHPLNAALGNGPLTDRRQLVVLADYDKEMPARYHPDWTWQQKNQYFQERFADRLIAELKDCSNVIFEMFNEGEWYEPAQRRLHEEHFLRFFRKRTTAPLATNVDHIRSRDFGARQNPAVDIISLHGKPWTGHFARFEREFKAEPARVVFETEPVPSFS